MPMNLRPPESYQSPLSSKLLPRVILSAALVVSALAEGCSKKISDVKIVDAVDILPQSPSPTIPSKPFKTPSKTLESFQISPEYGRMMNRYFDPKNTKTIIYIVDQHALSLDDVKGMEIQRKLYGIFEEIIRTQGVLPMVVEDLPADIQPNQITEDTIRSLGGGEILSEILRESDPVKKQIMARKFVGTVPVPAGMFAMLACSEMVTIGSVTHEDNAKTLKLMDGILLADRILKDPSSVNCAHSDFSLEEAMDRFLDGSQDGQILRCYCDVRHRIHQAIEDFSKDRFEVAPRKEMEAAFRYLQTSGDFVVVVAGLNHLPASMSLMKNASVNRIVIAPSELVSEFPQAMTSVSKKFPPTLPDRKDEACRKWEQIER